MCVVCIVCVCRAERVCRFVVSKSLGLSEEDRIRVSHFVHQLIKEGVVKREHFMQVCMPMLKHFTVLTVSIEIYPSPAVFTRLILLCLCKTCILYSFVFV